MHNDEQQLLPTLPGVLAGTQPTGGVAEVTGLDQMSRLGLNLMTPYRPCPFASSFSRSQRKRGANEAQSITGAIASSPFCSPAGKTHIDGMELGPTRALQRAISRVDAFVEFELSISSGDVSNIEAIHNAGTDGDSTGTLCAAEGTILGPADDAGVTAGDAEETMGGTQSSAQEYNSSDHKSQFSPLEVQSKFFFAQASQVRQTDSRAISASILSAETVQRLPLAIDPSDAATNTNGTAESDHDLTIEPHHFSTLYAAKGPSRPKRRRDSEVDIKHSRVGPRFQAEVLPLPRVGAMHFVPTERGDERTFDPSLLPAESMHAYLKSVWEAWASCGTLGGSKCLKTRLAGGKFRSKGVKAGVGWLDGYTVELALAVLHRNDYDPAAAMFEIRERPPPRQFVDHWSQHDRGTFEHALCAFGKDFPAIRSLLPNKTASELVAYFYDRKRRLDLSKGQPMFLDSQPLILGPQRRGAPHQPPIRNAVEQEDDELRVRGAIISRDVGMQHAVEFGPACAADKHKGASSAPSVVRIYLRGASNLNVVN